MFTNFQRETTTGFKETIRINDQPVPSELRNKMNTSREQRITTKRRFLDYAALKYV